MSWHLSNPTLVEAERRVLAATQPLMNLEVLPAGTRLCDEYRLEREAIVARGPFRVMIPKSERSYDYEVAIVFPPNYPVHPPTLVCIDFRLPSNLDRHILPNKQACLGVHAEVAIRWRSNPTLAQFFDGVVLPFLAWQLYYETYGEAPFWGGRSHGKAGVCEFYAELLVLPPADSRVVRFLPLLSRKDTPRGHMACPCGSGKRLRACHGAAVWAIRDKVSTDLAAYDEKLLNGPVSSPLQCMLTGS